MSQVSSFKEFHTIKMIHLYPASASKLYVQPIIIFYTATVYFEVFHTVHSHITIHLFKYTKQLHNIYSLHIQGGSNMTGNVYTFLHTN
jgi:hypothetical protein